MFCSSLRKRRDWALVPSNLLAQQQPRWKGSRLAEESRGFPADDSLEETLETHDLAFPVPQRHPQEGRRWFRLLLLTSADIQPPSNHMARIERLYHQTGGLDVGIVFLLRDNNTQENGTKAFMALQLRYAPQSTRRSQRS